MDDDEVKETDPSGRYIRVCQKPIFLKNIIPQGFKMDDQHIYHRIHAMLVEMWRGDLGMLF